MRESTRNQTKVGANGDMTWTLCGRDEYLRWLNVDPNTTRPTNMGKGGDETMEKDQYGQEER